MYGLKWVNEILIIIIGWVWGAMTVDGMIMGQNKQCDKMIMGCNDSWWDEIMNST